MSKYENLDAELIAAIKNGANTMSKLEVNNTLTQLAEPFREKQRWELTPVFRIIERRLQALRKKGVIAYNAKTWGIAESTK